MIYEAYQHKVLNAMLHYVAIDYFNWFAVCYVVYMITLSFASITVTYVQV